MIKIRLDRLSDVDGCPIQTEWWTNRVGEWRFQYVAYQKLHDEKEVLPLESITINTNDVSCFHDKNKHEGVCYLISQNKPLEEIAIDIYELLGGE